MNYVALEKLLAKVAKKSGGTPDFHQAFIDAIKQETDSIKAHTPDYDKNILASEIRYVNQASLINKILKIIRTKLATPGISEKEQAILNEYQIACQLAMLEEPKVRMTLFAEYERTIVCECLDEAEKFAFQDEDQPFAQQIGLKLDTLGSFSDIINHFRAKRNTYIAQGNQQLARKIDILLSSIIDQARPLIQVVQNDALLNQIEPYLLNYLYSKSISLLNQHLRTTDPELKPIIDNLVSVVRSLQETPEAAAKFYANLFRLQSYFVNRINQKTQEHARSQQQPALAAQIENAINEAQDVLANINERLQEFAMQGSTMRASLQDTNDRMTLHQIAKTALSTIGNDKSVLKLRTLLSQLALATTQTDENVQAGTSFTLGENKLLVKKVLAEAARYQKRNSSFFRNPLSKAHSTAKQLTEGLNTLTQQNPALRLLQDEIHAKNQRSTLGLAAKDKIEKYNLSAPAGIIAQLLSKTPWIATAMKIVARRHQDKADQLKHNIELIASATQLSQLPPDLSKLVSLTRYHDSGNGIINDKMRSEAIFRLILKDLVDASNIKEDGKFVSHKQRYAGILTTLLKQTRSNRTLEMQALLIPAQLDLAVVSVKTKSTDTEVNNWLDFIRDKIHRISQKLGEKIPDELLERYPGKTHYDGETIMKEYAHFLLKEDRKVALYSQKDLKQIKSLLKSVIDNITPSLSPEYQQYVKTSRADIKRAKKEGEQISISTSSTRTHYIGLH